MAERKKKNDATLPFAALQLLAPPVRLVSAALWKVMKQRDVMQYGVVEEFVTSACETVPGLLTVRHQGKLALGLRGRLILELCCKHPDEKVIMSHLARIRAPAALSSSSDHIMKRDVKILRTVESFHLMVHALLTDAAEREEFFKEEFPVDYGPEFDLELEKLLWEFLIRLDQLLPVPNLTQTVAWLSDAPAVLEECACAATQPQLLKILLQHQTCLGHLETAASLPPNMGDSILASLSLPPSGKVPSRAKMSARESSEGTQPREETPFITPVFGIISSEDVPALISTNKGTQRGDDVTKENSRFTMVKQKQNSKDCDEEQTEEMNASKRSSGIKRKHPDSQESDEEAEVCRKSAEKETRRSLTKTPSGLDRSRGEDGAVGNVCNREAVEIRVRLPEDPSLRSVFVSCLRSQPRVVLKKLPKTSDGTSTTSAWRKPPRIKGQDQRTESKGRAPAHERTSSRSQKPEAAFPGPDNKENRPVLVGVSASQQRRNTGTSTLTGDGDDYVADSEDEATKNFKDRLFLKRYCKTKHGTYVPTLREYFRPRTARRHLLTAGGKHR